MITYKENNLYSIDLNSLDNKKIYNEILQGEKLLKKRIPLFFFNSGLELNRANQQSVENADWKGYGSYSTENYHMYNTFNFPFYETSKLYRELVNNISPFLNKKEKYGVQCWFNVFRKGENIDWHSHWPPKSRVWHGFYCVYVEDSFTEYKYPPSDTIIKVPSKEGRLVFGKSNNDLHRSSEWDNLNKARITIAFDIVPYKTIIDEIKESDKDPNNITIQGNFIPFQ